MSKCSKHPIRSRKDCAECQGGKPSLDVTPRELPKDLGKIKISKKKDLVRESEERDRLDDIVVSKFVYKTPEVEEITLKEVKSDSDRVRDYIDKLINERLGNIKKDIYELKTIDYEHCVCPSSMFNLDLLFKLEKEGWQFCNSLVCTEACGYSFVGPAVILKRIVKSTNKQAPNFIKKGK